MFDAEIQSCKRCRLYRGVLNAVPGEGSEVADIVVVGEAPGETETREARPFVGEAGKQLNEFLRKASISREDVYITNAIHCQPPDNRTPTSREIGACSRFLFRELKTIRPKVILCLGATAANCLIGRKHYGTVEKAHGDAFRCFVTPTLIIPAVVTWHPASFFRPHPEIRKEYTVRDFRRAKQIAAAIDSGGRWTDYKG